MIHTKVKRKNALPCLTIPSPLKALLPLFLSSREANCSVSGRITNLSYFGQREENQFRCQVCSDNTEVPKY